LTVNDVIQINYNDKVYEIKVLEAKPFHEDHSGISIVETDLEVDFAPPVGYVEPSKQQKSQTMVCVLLLIIFLIFILLSD
jgi:ubiquitin fusion degradation protein 1